ncbi:MAG: hypothetical protein ABW033_04570 [Acidimicrobiia bacterium]
MSRWTRTNALLVLGAVAVLVSGWVHFYLYFRGGYRGIAPESTFGLTISRSFAVNAIVAVVIAEALVLATRFESLVLPSAASGALFGVGTLAAYFLSRTTGLLGFEESSTTTEAVVAMIAEVVAVLSLAPVAIGALARRRAPTTAPA